jgi:Helix-turn-helix domain
MSLEAMTWVIKHSKQKASSRFVLMMIANHAHADGTGSYPRVGTLAKECGMSERQVKRTLPELEASGELVVFWSKGRKPHEYAIPMGESNSDILSLLKIEHEKRSATPNSDTWSPLTVPPERPNRDISAASTVTNRPAHIRNEPSLEPSERERAAPSSPAATRPSRKQERIKTRPDLDDRAWLEHLRSLDENRGVDIDALYTRMLDWSEKNRATPSRLRLLKWVEKERSDVPVSYRPPIATNGHRAPRAGETFAVTNETATLPPARTAELRPPPDLPIEQTEAWNALRRIVREMLPPETYENWIRSLVFDGIADGGELILRGTKVSIDWVSKYYGEKFREAMDKLDMTEHSIRWVVEEEQEARAA